MGLFGKKKAKKQVQQPAVQVQVGGVENVVTIPDAKMVSGSKYFQDALNSIQGDTVQVAIVDRSQMELKYDDYAVVLPGMVPVGTLSQYGLEKLNRSCGDVVTAIVQRPPASGNGVKLWIPIAK